MKLDNRRRLIVVTTVLAALSMLLFSRIPSVQATIDDVHAGMVMTRLHNEIMKTTPVGLYYRALLFKHINELVQIMRAYPEHEEIIEPVIREFIPELEAWLDGKGDTVYITSEHIDRFRAELDWFALVGSPSLREDIEREKQRLQIDNFIGMTMNEAWDYINSKWTSDMVIDPSQLPELIYPTSTPTSLVPTPRPPEWVENKILVPNPDGEWAYYVHHGVYLEYPASYHIQKTEENLFFMKSRDASAWRDPSSIIVQLWNLPLNEKEKSNSGNVFPPENIFWEKAIQNEDFEGTEFILRDSSDSSIILGSMLYNREYQLEVTIHVNGVTALPEGSDYYELINKEYGYFQHMIDNIRIQAP